MIKCKICGKECTTFRGLSFHIKVHKTGSKEYYDRFLKKEGEGVCPGCGKETRFKGLGRGYHLYCSYICAGTSDKVKKKIKQTFLEKYGTENPMFVDAIREKQKQTCLKNLGVENPSQSNIVKGKKKQTCMENHGVENPSQSIEILEKKRQTSLNNYGVDNPNQSEIVRDKIKQTNLERYNVVNPFQSELVKNKIKQINIEKYGTEYLIQAHITNFDKWYNKKFIKENFLTDEKHVKVKKMMEFFNISESSCYVRLKNLGIDYKSRSGTSHYEQEIYEFLRFELGILNIIQNDRQLIKPLEVDFLLSDYKLAIEFNGLYWHSNKFKSKNYHLNKFLLCKKQGVNLIHIWEDKWLEKKETFKSMLKRKLHKTS